MSIISLIGYFQSALRLVIAGEPQMSLLEQRAISTLTEAEIRVYWAWRNGLFRPNRSITLRKSRKEVPAELLTTMVEWQVALCLIFPGQDVTLEKARWVWEQVPTLHNLVRALVKVSRAGQGIVGGISVPAALSTGERVGEVSVPQIVPPPVPGCGAIPVQPPLHHARRVQTVGRESFERSFAAMEEGILKLTGSK
jgi:hypothetical protein